MMDTPGKRTEIYVQPGEVAAGGATHVFKTLLGSCVSITLWHPHRRIGAISHFLLPSRGKTIIAESDGRYADEAVALMCRLLSRVGVHPVECQAKLFGGGRMFYGEAQPGLPWVERRNGEIARELLRMRGIKIVSEDLFGIGHRKLVFDVSNGDVWSRQVQPGDPDWQGTR